MKRLSLLLPTYNRVKNLKELVAYLESERVFEDSRIEVLLSNNGSTDGTYEYVASLKFPNLTVFHQKENLGAIGNFKFLTEQATAEYVWLLGDNDMYRKDAIHKMMDYFDKYPDVAHFFLNYDGVNREGISISEPCLAEKQIGGEKQIYEDGFEMICDITNESELGTLMFVSANIFKRKIVQEANALFETYGEGENMALPLGYSMYSGMYAGMCIREVLVGNEADTPLAWSDSKILVNCREMLAIYDTVIEYCGMGRERQNDMRSLFIRHLPAKFPEYRYLFHMKKFKKDNYAMKFYQKHCPWKLISDVLILPFCCVVKISRKLMKGI